MAHIYSQLYYHLVWSTKLREPIITKLIRYPLYTTIREIILNMDSQLLSIGGVEDHVHILMITKPQYCLSNQLREIKSKSSRWVSDEFNVNFKWQEGGGLFTVSASAVLNVKKYIREQEIHHKTMTFLEEYEKIVKIHDDFSRQKDTDNDCESSQGQGPGLT